MVAAHLLVAYLALGSTSPAGAGRVIIDQGNMTPPGPTDAELVNYIQDNVRDQDLLSYLLEKSSELGNMGKADLALAYAVWLARSSSTLSEKQFVKVSEVHPLHPVGPWRPDTWAKTLGRKQAVIDAKDMIVESDGKLSEKAIETTPSLQKLHSITPFIAVPFPFCQSQYVLLEGNGRMKGIQLAAASAPELASLEVEVEILGYPPERLPEVQKGLEQLWREYTNEMLKMPRSIKDSPEFRTFKAKIKEYSTFSVGLVECADQNGCEIWKQGSGKSFVRRVDYRSLHGVSRRKEGPTSFWYFLCDGSGGEFILDKTKKSVTELCPECYDHLMCPVCI